MGMKRHLKLLLGYMEKTLEREIRQYEATFDHQTSNTSLEHQHLWMGYKPGELLFSMPDDAECVVRMASMSKVMKPMFRSTEIDRWIINVERIEWQGERMVWFGSPISSPSRTTTAARELGHYQSHPGNSIPIRRERSENL